LEASLPRYSYPGGDSQEHRIRQLGDELWHANHTIVALAPAPFSAALASYHGCKSREDFWNWRQRAITAVTDAAKEDPNISYAHPRGYCPLCGGGSQGPYDRGFSLPEGLRQHLDGHGNTARCPITKAAFWLAQRDLQHLFDAEERDREAKVLERRETERLFLTNPNQPPGLLDEGAWRWGGTPRDAAGLNTADQRLRALGFVAETIGNVAAWRFRHESWTVLADPRPPRAIEFVVFVDAVQGGTRRPSALKVSTASFTIQDSWKHDISGKFRQRLEEAIGSLEKRQQK
jgi:hypothetical protein